MTAMSVNRDRGEVALAMGGESYVLHYDWTAIGRLRELGGDKDLEAILAGLAEGDAEGLAAALVIGLARNHPDITAADVVAYSPPLVHTIAALSDALTLAFFGPKGAPEDDSPGGPLKSAATLSKRRKKRRSGRA